MRLNYSIIRSIELFTILIMIGFSTYSLISNKIYELMTVFLQSIFQIEFLFPIYPFLPILLILSLFSISLYLFARGRQKYLDKVYVLSWLIHLPSILHFSQIDWLQAVGLPINLQTIETSLSFIEVLIISMILVAGRIVLLYTSQTREVYLELLERGAEKNDLEEIALGMIALTSLCIGSSIMLSLAVSYLTLALKFILSPIIMSLPYPYIIIGVTCLLMIPTCIIVYLYSVTHD